jgi:hypothetical protein
MQTQTNNLEMNMIKVHDRSTLVGVQLFRLWHNMCQLLETVQKPIFTYKHQEASIKWNNTCYWFLSLFMHKNVVLEREEWKW